MSDMLRNAAIESAVLAHFQIISLRKDESSAKRIKASKMCGDGSRNDCEGMQVWGFSSASTSRGVTECRGLGEMFLVESIGFRRCV